MLQSFIDRCNRKYDASLLQHLRWSRWVLPPLLSAVRPKPTWVTGAVLRTSALCHIPPLASPAPKPPVDSTDVWAKRCSHIGHQVWIKTQRFLGLFILLMSWSYMCVVSLSAFRSWKLSVISKKSYQASIKVMHTIILIIHNKIQFVSVFYNL